MAVYIVIFGTMSLRRHQNLRTNALDLGYTDQVVWNTLHGRPFRFSTYLDAAFRLDIPVRQVREPDVLLAYHVEPILVAIAPLYLLHNGPETLLWLQTVVIAFGALPVYWIARRRLARPGSPGAGATVESQNWMASVSAWLPVAFVLLYLLSPSLEAANLSDFHAVALAPTLLLAAFYLLETGRPQSAGTVLVRGSARYRCFLGAAFALLAALCKEEVGLIVGLMGLWFALQKAQVSEDLRFPGAAWRRWALGVGIALAGAGWSFLCFQVIMPHFSGLAGSAFLVRYSQFGDSPAGILRNLVRHPGLFADWLARPDVLRYLRDLWASSGGLAVFHPASLALALPSLVVNLLSASDWMRSGGGHYSVTIVPFLVIAAIYSTAWLSETAGRWLAPRLPAPRSDGLGRSASRILSLALVTLGLGVALAHHHQTGVSPLSRRFAWEPVGEHARRAQPLIDRVNNLPPQVRIAAGSNLYPHVAHRELVYLFPTVGDAEFILLDVTGSTEPVSPGDQYQVVRDLLDYAEFGVAASDHGVLLLERGLDAYTLAPSFYDAFLAGEAAPEQSLLAGFGSALRLQGFDWYVRPVVRPELVAEIATYWQPLAPLEEEFRLVFHFWDGEGQMVRVQPEERVLHWFPTWSWEPGTTVKVTLPPLPVGDLPHVGVAILGFGAQDLDPGGRIGPIIPSAGSRLTLWENDTILELTRP